MSTTTATPLRNEVSLGLFLMVFSVLVSPVIDIFAKLAVAAVPATKDPIAETASAAPARPLRAIS